MKMNTSRQYKSIIGIVMILASSVVFCDVPQYQEDTVEPMFESSKQALNEAIRAVDASLSAALELYSQRINSAIAVLTKQKAVAANQISDANRTAAQATAQSLNVLSMSERVKQARLDYSGEFGQGFQPCMVYTIRNLMANRESDMNQEIRTRMMSEIVAAPGRYANASQTMQMFAKNHRDNFCTQDQVNSGMCSSVGSMAGASLQASTLFEPTMESDNLYKAKVAFVNNIVGLPNEPIPQSAAKTPAASNYVLAKAQRDALMSPALVSLKEIQLDHTGLESSHNGSDIPMALRLSREVKRYLGNTPEYVSWSKVMAAQNTRGLMVEMLKIKSLDLVLLEKQYRQYERMEAILATLVANDMSAHSTRAAFASEQATRQDVMNQIK